ncbi:hypothetical protein [Succinimonas amylolytica]|uniref:hypothetical protein n=1 Tax=Succinimonas amylolytica TaxID=83769 RepID=UPI00037A2C92|nr:hypothetical protein [Succinimonas amylolytica]
MEIKFNLKGAERKELVKAISRITGIKAEYQGTPSMNYQIGDFTVTREGNLVYDDKVDPGELLNELAEAGFEGTADKSEDKELKVPEPNILTIEMPADKVNTGNLQKLLDAKGALIRKALGIDNLAFEIHEDRVSFPWFIDPAPDHALAYTQFIAAICKMSTEQKRVTARVRDIDNEKYAFRCFLLRLGFIGDEFKKSRKILLTNLDGSSAFKTVKENLPTALAESAENNEEVHDELSE